MKYENVVYAEKGGIIMVYIDMDYLNSANIRYQNESAINYAALIIQLISWLLQHLWSTEYKKKEDEVILIGFQVVH